MIWRSKEFRPIQVAVKRALTVARGSDWDAHCKQSRGRRKRGHDSDVEVVHAAAIGSIRSGM